MEIGQMGGAPQTRNDIELVIVYIEQMHRGVID